ncbi:DUF5681 domain-containing protein [Terriglobus aquaticus]|uniref:DUF5681 domain-containing protein n=1 Tax=Terriglobus aquaticus TaxID=940139 RepID=A0ABW9KJ21_9BACT|nr:DUF5681 domain-containing protein [Terriglobus aquaticus]
MNQATTNRNPPEQHRFQPGQSGNPSGRPKKAPITDYLREQLDRAIPAGMLDKLRPEERSFLGELFGTSPTFGHMVAFKTIQQACKGDVFALRELLDRVEGKVTRTVEHAGEVGIRTILIPQRTQTAVSQPPAAPEWE